MCGRYVVTKPVTKTSDLVKTTIKVEDRDNYNAHPTQKLPVIGFFNVKQLKIFVGNMELKLTIKIKK